MRNMEMRPGQSVDSVSLGGKRHGFCLGYLLEHACAACMRRMWSAASGEKALGSKAQGEWASSRPREKKAFNP